MDKNKHFLYVLQLADNALILGHRLSEWCGHGPVLEQDIAMTNISLDHVGQARMYFQYAAELEGEGKTEDDLAYHRDAWDFRNLLLLEQPNGDWGNTLIRSFFYDAYHKLFLEELLKSNDERLVSIAQKAIKEVTYHLRYTSEWTIRLGDGTEESHARMQKAIDHLWPYTGEIFIMNDIEKWASELGIGPDITSLKPQWEQYIKEIFDRATLSLPENPYIQQGGKNGLHSEHLGYILAELQFVQRAYPGMEW